MPTGSELKINAPMPLQMMGMVGELVADDTAWIIKSHDPLRYKCQNFTVNKVIICVRNPFDVIISNVNFLNAFSHSKELAN